MVREKVGDQRGEKVEIMRAVNGNAWKNSPKCSIFGIVGTLMGLPPRAF